MFFPQIKSDRISAASNSYLLKLTDKLFRSKKKKKANGEKCQSKCKKTSSKCSAQPYDVQFAVTEEKRILEDI